MEIKNIGSYIRVRADVDFLSKDELSSFECEMNDLMADFMSATPNEKKSTFGALVAHVEKWEEISARREGMFADM